jgi:diacylglycerol kinase family enzyme
MPKDTGTSGPLFIVMNRGSGHNDADQTRATIAKIFEEAGREHRFLLLEQPGDLPRQAKNAVELAVAAGGIVVAAGGDGTLNGVAQAVLGSGCSFGVLPQGTFNLFGRVHGIPQETEAQARALLSAHVEHVQVGLVNDQVFLVNASVGFYPQVLEDREEYKKRFGRSRAVAVAAGFVTLARYRKQLHLDVETDGRSYSLTTPTLFVGNNRLQLERIGIAEADRIEQGVLAGIVVKPIRTRSMFALAVRGALGTLGDAENIHGFSLRKLTVKPRGKQRIKVATDGEVQWMKAPLVFRVAPHALPLLVPVAHEKAAVA